MTLYRDGVGQIGTTTANSSGQWNFDYSGTTLPGEVTAFTATATVNSVTSQPSSDYLVTVDLTPPTVTVSVPATTGSMAPQVRVVASDLNGLPNGTTVTSDVELSGNNYFTNGYATGSLTNDVAMITRPAFTGTGTYEVRARVTNQAGHQGTSSTHSFQVVTVSNPWVPSGGLYNNPDPLSGMALELMGNVSVSQPVNLTTSPGGGDGALGYNSDTTGVHPIIQAILPTPNNTSLPSSIAGTLTWDVGVNQQVTTYTWNTTGAHTGDQLTLAAWTAATVTTTGYHNWQLQLLWKLKGLGNS